MSSAATVAPMIVRSSMELMLDAIRQRDEKPKDVPPALPARPTSRGRLPTSRRSLLGSGIKLENRAPKSLLMESTVVVLESRILRSKRMPKVEQQPDESPYPNMPELESYQGRVEEVNSMEILFDEELGWFDTNDRAREKVTAPEDSRSQMLQGILRIQKYYRGLRARCDYHEILKGATTLQSFVRGERERLNFECQMKRWRAVVLVQKHVQRWIARKTYHNQKKDIILLQSVIRGFLVRKQFVTPKNRETSKLTYKKIYQDPSDNRSIKETNEDNNRVQPLVLAQLQSRVLEAELELQQKEDNNAILQQQLQQYKQKCSEYEVKMKTMEEAVVALQKKEEENATLQEQLQQQKQIWLAYEAKMKLMEETWQKQLTALQVSLAAAKRTLASDDWTIQRGSNGASRIHHHYDTDDALSTETRTSEDTPAKQNHISDAGVVGSIDGKHNAVGYLIKEFEQRSQVFEDYTGFLITVKSGQSTSKIKPDEEFQKLKARFSAWKKDYKVRLRETKTALQKLASSEEKTRKRWWARRSTK